METNGDLLGSSEPGVVVAAEEAVVEKPPVLVEEEDVIMTSELKQTPVVTIDPESSPPMICEEGEDGDDESKNNNGPSYIVIIPSDDDEEESASSKVPKSPVPGTGEKNNNNNSNSNNNNGNAEEDMPELTVQSELPVQHGSDEGPPEITSSVQGDRTTASDLNQETEPKMGESSASKVGDEKSSEKQAAAADVDDSMDDSLLRVSDHHQNDEAMETSTGTAGASETGTTPPASSERKEKKKKKTRSELDRLLMDEGTVKILMGSSSRSGRATSPNVSKKDKLKELNKYREQVVNQVRESSRSKLFNKVSLREKSKSRRQQLQEKNAAKKAKLEPTSKIIRRRSSSSNFNFSSRSPSPVQMSRSPSATPVQPSADDPHVQVRVADSVGYITISSEAILFNTQITSRLTTTLNSLKHDESVTVVQVTAGKHFIKGLDIEAVRSETDDSLRQSMADSMVACLDSLLKTLSSYPKLLVAGVTGEAVDFGVLILSCFDLVYASDKATFQTHYVKNGNLPECIQLLPKNRLTHALLYTGKKLTAAEAVTAGLVTEALTQAKFTAELASRIRTLTSGNHEILLRTKGEVTAKNFSKLELTRDLRSSWLGCL